MPFWGLLGQIGANWIIIIQCYYLKWRLFVKKIVYFVIGGPIFFKINYKKIGAFFKQIQLVFPKHQIIQLFMNFTQFLRLIRTLFIQSIFKHISTLRLRCVTLRYHKSITEVNSAKLSAHTSSWVVKHDWGGNKMYVSHKL